MDRRGYLGASDAPIIMGGDATRIYELWQIKTGVVESIDLEDPEPLDRFLGRTHVPF